MVQFGWALAKSVLERVGCLYLQGLCAGPLWEGNCSTRGETGLAGGGISQSTGRGCDSVSKLGC